MNEYVITFKHDDEGFMRHIFAENEDDAVGIAFARARGMNTKFDNKKVYDLDIQNISKPKKASRSPRETFEAALNDPPMARPVTLNDAVGDVPNWGTPATLNVPPVAAPPVTHVTMAQAEAVFRTHGAFFREQDWRVGYQFYMAGRDYMIVPGPVNETMQATTQYVNEGANAAAETTGEANRYQLQQAYQEAATQMENVGQQRLSDTLIYQFRVPLQEPDN